MILKIASINFAFTVSNNRATPAKSLHRTHCQYAVPAQQKSGASDRVQPPLVCMHGCHMLINLVCRL